MKKALYLLVFITFILGCNQFSNDETTSENTEKVFFDPMLAEKLGADEYGMKQYVMAFLKSGPNRDQDSATVARLQKAHMDNIIRMANEGSLVLAGPFMDNGEIKGIYIFNVKTVEEAEVLTATDPAIKAGRLVMELHPWYGSAAVMQINDIHSRLAQKEI